METKSIARRLRNAALVAIGSSMVAALAFAGVAGVGTADAAGSASISLGVGCSSSNGVKTLRLTPRAYSSGTVWITNMIVEVDNNPGTEHDSPPLFTKSYSPGTITIANIAQGVYPILITVDTLDTVGAVVGQVTRTGVATITAYGCSVRTPA